MKQRGFIPIVILILTTLAAVAYFGYKYIQNKIPDGSTFPVEWATSSPSSGPAANWKTYFDPSGYEFSYPQELELEKLTNKVIVRIDPPDLRDKVGICPRYVSFSLADSKTSTRFTEDQYSCVYEARIESKKIFIETQYPKNNKGPIDQILSTFKFLDGEIPQITEEELSRGWYWGSSSQKKPGTPMDWAYTESGKNSCWHSPTSSCRQ